MSIGQRFHHKLMKSRSPWVRLFSPLYACLITVITVVRYRLVRGAVGGYRGLDAPVTGLLRVPVCWLRSPLKICHFKFISETRSRHTDLTRLQTQVNELPGQIANHHFWIFRRLVALNGILSEVNCRVGYLSFFYGCVGITPSLQPQVCNPD